MHWPPAVWGCTQWGYRVRYGYRWGSSHGDWVPFSVLCTEYFVVRTFTPVSTEYAPVRFEWRRPALPPAGEHRQAGSLASDSQEPVGSGEWWDSV